MPIQCNEINQNVNYLLSKFQDCSKLEASDMQLLVELIAAVNTCANGGVNYDTIENFVYEPEVNQVITYPINTFHSISVVVVQGTIGYIGGLTLQQGTSINIELTTLNQEDFTFTANAGSKVLVEYITE